MECIVKILGKKPWSTAVEKARRAGAPRGLTKDIRRAAIIPERENLDIKIFCMRTTLNINTIIHPPFAPCDFGLSP